MSCKTKMKTYCSDHHHTRNQTHTPQVAEQKPTIKMKQLIQALNIFAKYIGDSEQPISCERDILFVNCDPNLVSNEDKALLSKLGFDDNGCSFFSDKYSS